MANVITMAKDATIQNAEQIFQHPDVALLCVTGGPAVVKAAMKFGKKVIAAGPGNPPVVVDETADLDAAAKAIIAGASFDNNLLCIGEKEVFVVASVADAFLESMRRAGAVQLDARAIDALTAAVFTFTESNGVKHPHVKREDSSARTRSGSGECGRLFVCRRAPTSLFGGAHRKLIPSCRRSR